MAGYFKLSSFFLRQDDAARQPAMQQQRSTEFVDDDGGDRRVDTAEPRLDEPAWGDALPKGWFSWRKLWLFTGPGFLMSIAYLVRPLRRLRVLLPCLAPGDSGQ